MRARRNGRLKQNDTIKDAPGTTGLTTFVGSPA